MKNTLRGQLILSVALVHALMMSLFLFDSTVRQEGLLLENQIHQAVAMSQALATSAAGWMAAADVSGLQELVDAQKRFPEMRFAIIADETGFILAHSDRSRVGSYLRDLPPVLQQTFLNRSSELVDVAVPALVAETPVGWVRVGLGQKNAAERLSRLVWLGVVYAVVAIAIGSAVAWVVGLRITKRFFDLLATITSVKTGNRAARSHLKGTDEAATLAQEFNAMLDRAVERDQALLQSEEKYRSLLGLIPVAVVVHGPDTRILLCNPMASALLGLDEDQAVGKEASDPDWRFLREDGSGLPSEEYPVHQVLRTGCSMRGRVLGIERPAPLSAVWVFVNADPVLDNGKVVQIVVTFIDITEQRRVDAELRRLTLMTERILNSAGEGIYGTDLQGRLVFINPAALSILEYTEAEALGKDSHELFHHTRSDGSPYPVAECPLHQALGHGVTTRMKDDVYWTRDGGKIPVEHVNSPLIDHGAIAGAVVVFRDVAESKRAEEEIRQLNESLETRVREGIGELKDSQAALMNLVEDLNEKTGELETANAKLKELDRLKSMFIASMSHELRTPLNSVIGFSSILLNEWTGPLTGEQKDLLSTILRSGRHLLALITDVIDVSKIEAGKLESLKERFDAYDAGMEAVLAFSEEAKKKDLTIEFHGVHRTIFADRRRLLQCLLNLVSNALKYTDRGKVEVEVAVSDAGDWLEFRVSDTGIGISPEQISTLFSPFVRIILPQRPVVPGTGLGLYLSKKLAQEVLGGDILVESTQGAGSRFLLQIPLEGEERPV